MGHVTKANMTQRISQRNLLFTNQGFTLIEIIIAIIVLSIGVFAVIALSGKSYGAISLQKNKLIALNLAREEIEILRSKRDENWLTSNDCTGTGTCENRRTEETDARPTTPCDWRCGLGEDILDIDYLSDTNTSSLYGPGSPGNCILTEGCPLSSEVCPTTGARCPLYIDANGYYQHNGTAQGTQFYRIATIEQDTDLNGDGNIENDFSVIVNVCWQERGGKWQGICLEDHLYNWAH